MEEGLRDQPQLPERRHLDAAQPRVHDARSFYESVRGLRASDADDGRDMLATVARDAAGRDGWVTFGEHTIFARGTVPAFVASATRRRKGEGRRRSSAVPWTGGRSNATRRRPRAVASDSRPSRNSAGGRAPARHAMLIFETLWEQESRAADVRLRFSDRSLAPSPSRRPTILDTVERFELYAGGSRDRQWLQRAQRPGPSSARRFESQAGQPQAGVTPKRTQMDEDYIRRACPTASRRRVGKASASTASSCC